MDGLGCGDVPSEDDQGNEIECEQDPPNWQALVSREVLAGLTPQEIKRQEVINGEAGGHFGSTYCTAAWGSIIQIG